VPPRSPKKPVSLVSLVSSPHISSFLQEAALLSGHCILALARVTAPLKHCVTSLVAASAVFARCDAVSRRALRANGEALHKQRYLACGIPVGVRVSSHDQRDLYRYRRPAEVPICPDFLGVSRGFCTRSRLTSRQENEMTLVDLMQLGVTSRSVYATMHYRGVSIHRHSSAPSEAPYKTLYHLSPSMNGGVKSVSPAIVAIGRGPRSWPVSTIFRYFMSLTSLAK
jgi:hypothetical protein